MSNSNLNRFDKVLSEIFEILEAKLIPKIDTTNPWTYQAELHESIEKECLKFIDALDIPSIESDQKRHKVFMGILCILKTTARDNLEDLIWTMIEAQDRYRHRKFYEEKSEYYKEREKEWQEVLIK